MLWNLSRGRLGANVSGIPVLELVTTGSKSGLARSILIYYLPTAVGPVVAGTNGGATHDPAWVNNLRANPVAKVKQNGVWRNVQARFLEPGEEYDRVWQSLVALSTAYADYRQSTQRSIPLAVLADQA